MKLAWLKNYNLLEFETIDSTNSEALRAAKSETADCVIISERQTGGRGSKGRTWVSIAGNLHMSILLNFPRDFKRHSSLSFLTANAMYSTLAGMFGERKLSCKIELKWPNDVLINGKKVAGTLLESISVNEKTFIVIGVGVNIIEAPGAVAFPSTSLYDEGVETGAMEFMQVLMQKFDKLYRKFLYEKDFTNIRKDWLRRAYNLNKIITINDGVKEISGTFIGIDLEGAIMLRLASGEIFSFVQGDVLDI